MAQNLLVLCAADGSPARVSALARESGATLGFVNTGIAASAMQTSGKRIEEERLFGGTTYHAFDEPLSVGSAIAQLAGYADAVVVYRLDDWAKRLLAHFTAPDGPEYITAELTAIASVMNAHMADVLLVSGPEGPANDPAALLHRRMLAEFRPHCTRVVDLSR
jgi:adenosyl cobinamide kinase/adenosyl cobinamide phosphate guanylyltransferase